MQDREKKLALSLLAVLVVVGGYVFIEGKWEQLDALGKRHDSAETNFAQVRLRKAAGDAAVRRLESWRTQSLPPDPDDAQRLYLAWLTNLAQMCEIDAIKVTPGRQIPKGKTYVGVQVVVEGQATIDRLARFHYRFERTDLPHRIVRLNLESAGSEGNPLLTFKLTTEALSVPDAKPHDVLFPQTTLAGDLAADATTMTVTTTANFPTKGTFRVRLGSEYITVTKADGKNWSITRGVDGTKASTYASKGVVELAPLIEAKQALTFEEYRRRIEGSPFVKPQRYNPRLDKIEDQLLVRGESINFLAQAGGFDADDGDLAYRLKGDLPPGILIDARTGAISWKPAEKQPVGEWKLTLTVAPTRNEKAEKSQSFQVTLREPNNPPVLEPISGQTVFLGDTLTFTVKAIDPDGDALAYYLEEESDDGAKIDPDTGEFVWTPAEELDFGDYDVTVIVADGGKPQQSIRQKVTITIADNIAEFTYLVASIAADDDRQAWLYDRSQNKRLVLREGKLIEVAGMKVLVAEIARDHIILKRGNDMYRLKLGRNLRAMEKLPASKLPAEAPPAPALPEEEAKTAEKPAS
jgi:hypothetical protein